MVLVRENTLERLQQRQQILTPPIAQTLRNLDSEMTDILSSKVLDDEQKAKLYNQVLQRYLSYYDQRKGQPLHVKISTPRAVETPKPEENEQPTEEPVPENLESVPKIYKAGAIQLLDKIKEHQDVLHWNDKGELLYDTKPITDSHLVDLVNDTLRHRKGFEPVGSSVFCEGSGANECPEKSSA